VIAGTDLSGERLTSLVNRVQRIAREVFLVPNMRGLSVLGSELYYLFLESTLIIRIRNNLMSPYRRFLKRSFDLLLSILLIPLLIPLFIIIAILIKIDSPGPVFFRHRRVGKGGKEFHVLKFRTMHVDAEKRLKELLENDSEARREWERFYKLKNDPRITRVGRFLRKTSLDELPQVINVLKGEMSFVGPRPVVEEELFKYYGDRSVYYLMTRPGITGLWQVSGRNLLTYEERVELDTWYVMNWNMWLDVVILIKTVGAVVKGEGAR